MGGLVVSDHADDPFVRLANDCSDELASKRVRR